MRHPLLFPGEQGGWVAEVPKLPGCVSQGNTREEAMKNIREAIELHIEVLREYDQPVPPEFLELL